MKDADALDNRQPPHDVKPCGGVLLEIPATLLPVGFCTHISCQRQDAACHWVQKPGSNAVYLFTLRHGIALIIHRKQTWAKGEIMTTPRASTF